jgi:hypothetical protein
VLHRPYREPAGNPGFYDVTGENNKPEGVRLTNVLLNKLEGKKPSEIEAEARRNDARKAKEQADAAPPVVAAMNRSAAHPLAPRLIPHPCPG